MAHTRILSENKLTRALSLVASNQVTSLPASNLRTSRKSSVWRSTTLTPTLTFTFTNLEAFNCLILGPGNVTAAHTINVKGYTNTGDTTPAWQSGAIAAAPYTPPAGDGTTPGVNSFGFNQCPLSVVYFTQQSAREIVVEISDTTNAAGYVEFAFLMAGVYWSPTKNVGYGASVSIVDRSKSEYDDASNLRTDRSTRSRLLTADFKNMPDADTEKLWDILWYNGTHLPMFVSIMPANGTPKSEQMYSMIGKLTKASRIMIQSFGISSAPIEFQEV